MPAALAILDPHPAPDPADDLAEIRARMLAMREAVAFDPDPQISYLGHPLADALRALSRCTTARPEPVPLPDLDPTELLVRLRALRHDLETALLRHRDVRDILDVGAALHGCSTAAVMLTVAIARRSSEARR